MGVFTNTGKKETLYGIREGTLKRIYEIPLSTNELSDKKTMEKLLKEIAKDVKKHKERHYGWNYEIRVNDKTCQELIDEGITHYPPSPTFKKYIPVILGGSGVSGGIAAYALATNFVSGPKASLIGLLGGCASLVLAALIVLNRSLNTIDKKFEERELLDKLEVYTKETSDNKMKHQSLALDL